MTPFLQINIEAAKRMFEAMNSRIYNQIKQRPVAISWDDRKIILKKDSASDTLLEHYWPRSIFHSAYDRPINTMPK